MRIDLLARYREVQSFISTPNAVTKEADESFKTLLGDIAPDRVEVSEIAKESMEAVVKELPREERRLASYNFQLPEYSVPGLSPRGGEFAEEIEIENVKELTEAVKPELPNLLRATRLSNSEAERISQLAPSEKLVEMRDLIGEAGRKHGIDPALGMGVAFAESSFNPKAVSSDGHASKGLFQLLDSTGKDVQAKFGVKGEEYDPFDPELNTDLGVAYLRYLHDIFSKPTELPNDMVTHPAENSSNLEKFAVAAFNAGEGRVAHAQHRALRAGENPTEFESVRPYLPEITQRYVDKVLRSRSEFAGDLNE